MRRLVVDTEACTGCRQCEVSCSFVKTGLFRLANARLGVVIWEEEAHAVPVVCQHCEDAECMRVCPTRAITRDPSTGAVVINPSLCVGCRACFAACPVAGMCMDDKGKPVKCDLCGGEPECVKACVPRAIRYEKDMSAVSRRRRILAQSLSPSGGR